MKDFKLALEGGVGAGKSSTCAMLENKHGFFHVKEYMSFAGNHTGATLSALLPKERFRYFLRVERTRVESASKHSSGRPYAIDRCFLSILAFEFAQRSLGKASISVDDIRSLFHEENLLVMVPDKLIFVDIKEETRVQRVTQRKKVVRGDLVSPPFSDAVRAFFKGVQNCFEVEWINGDVITMEELVRACLSVHKALSHERSGTITGKIPEAFLEIYRNA
jgi:thymidylate kinase